MATPELAIPQVPQLPPQQAPVDPIEQARALALAQPPAAAPLPNDPTLGTPMTQADREREAFLLANGPIESGPVVPATPAAPIQRAGGDTGGAVVLDPLPQPEQPQYHVERLPGASSSTSGSSGISKQSEARIRGAQEKVFGAVAGEIEAQAPQRARDAAAAEQVASLADERARLSAQHAAEAANLRDKIAKDNADARAKLDQDVADYQKAGDKIDPNRVWHRMDTGSKIAFALAAGLQGFASGLRGSGGNVVLEMMSAAQERDLRAQEIGLNAKARGVQMRESMYSRLVEAGHDKETAMLAARDASNHTIADQIAAAQAAANNAPAAERAAQAAAAWQTKMAADRQALEERVARHTTSSSTTQSQAMLVDQYGRPAQDAGQAIPGTKVIDPAVHQRVMSNPAQEKQAREVASALKSGVGAVRNMVKLREKYGTEVWDDSAKAEMAANMTLFTGSMGQMSGSGTVNAGEFPRFQKLAPDLSPHLSDIKRVAGAPDPTLMKLKALEKALTGAANRSMSSYGVALDFNDGAGQASRQVRGKDGRVYTLYADGRTTVQ